MKVLKTAEAAAVLRMSSSHFLDLHRKGILGIKPLPYSRHIKYWSAKDIESLVDNTPSKGIVGKDTILEALTHGNNQGALSH